MNTPLRHVAMVVVGMFLVLMGGVTWIQYHQAGSLNADGRNSRQLYREFGGPRGPIVVAGDAVARSVEVDDDFGRQREYTDGELYSTVTGFYSIVGKTALENAENSVLTGQSDQLFFTRVRDLLTGRSSEGAAVETTIVPAAQKAALEGLGKQQGAVVAIEPSTGKILALVSTPSFDPNLVAQNDTAKATAEYRKLEQAEGNPLRSNATLETYPPGSTFKLVTAAAALENGYTPETKVDSPRTLRLPGTSTDLPNFGGESCGGEQVSLADALRVSCNTAFANVGMDLGVDKLREQAEKFGFNSSDLTIPMPVVASRFPEELDVPQTALAAIGQGSVTATPMQMAMVAAGIANDGVVMKPYVVDTVRSADLEVVSQTQPQELSTAVSPQTAAELTEMMIGVVRNGTGTAAQIGGVEVAGKSGTAETAKGVDPHAWFTAFAPADDPQVAVAVIVERGGDMGSDATGGRVAAPIARAVIKAVLGS